MTTKRAFQTTEAQRQASRRYYHRHLEELREYHREYQRVYRAGIPAELRTQKRQAAERAHLIFRLQNRPVVSALCRAGKAVCESANSPHRHCECGLPIAPTAIVCVMCIAEQPRVERNLDDYRDTEEVA